MVKDMLRESRVAYAAFLPTREMAMPRFKARQRAASLSRLLDLLALIHSGKHLRRSLARSSSDELDRVLRRLGKSRRDLFTEFRGNARHRRRLAFMLNHFGVDPDFATHSHWDALRHADEACLGCPNVRRCRSWMSWGARNDAPRVFCPNAALLDAIAGQARTARAA